MRTLTFFLYIIVYYKSVNLGYFVSNNPYDNLIFVEREV